MMQKLMRKAAQIIAATAFLWLPAAPSMAADGAAKPSLAATLPAATALRIGGDAKQTRFILDLDRYIAVSAFALADPYRVVLDVPQVASPVGEAQASATGGLI